MSELTNWKHPKVQFISANQWRTIDVWTYSDPRTGKKFTVPFGMDTDGVSGDKFSHIIIDQTGALFAGGVVHDGMYTIHKWDDGTLMTRDEADHCIMDMAIESGIDEIVALGIYNILKQFGEEHWND